MVPRLYRFASVYKRAVKFDVQQHMASQHSIQLSRGQRRMAELCEKFEDKSSRLLPSRAAMAPRVPRGAVGTRGARDRGDRGRGRGAVLVNRPFVGAAGKNRSRRDRRQRRIGFALDPSKR